MWFTPTLKKQLYVLSNFFANPSKDPKNLQPTPTKTLDPKNCPSKASQP